MGGKHRISEIDENEPDPSQEFIKKRKRIQKQQESGHEDEEQLDKEDEEEFELEDEHEMDVDEEKVAGPGSIESVDLYNFMCHERLSTKFGKNINFLTGPNGSGKSAVLTALAVALGGKASFTNRGTSLSSLIKEGTDVGEIVVRIRNTGITAYKPDVYGDIIQIVRTMNRAGSGGYKIKSKKGQTISSRKADLMKIVDHFQISVDNPMAILTQDTARLFLANSTSAQKYEFFMKGTELSTLGNKLIELDSNINNIKDSVERKQELLPEMRAEVAEMKEKEKEMAAAAQYEETLQTLNGELVWSRIVVLEESRDEEEEKMNMHLEKYNDAEKKLRTEELKQATVEKSLDAIREREQTAKDTLKPMEASINAMKPVLNNLNRCARESTEDVNALKNQIAEAKSREETAQQALDRERQKQSVDQRGLEEERNRDIAAVERELQTAQDDYDIATEDIKKLDDLIQRETAETNRLGKEGSDLSRVIGDLQRNLAALQNRGNRIEAYGGAGLAGAMKEIEQCTRERRWKGQPPIGPFGLYVKLKKRECRSVVESILNHLLNGFGVDTAEDVRMLQGIFNRHKCRNTVYKYQASRSFNADVQNGRPESRYETIYDVLEISNDIVFQQLVIHNKIESIVLVRDFNDGDRVTNRNTYIPPRVSRVCTYDYLEVANFRPGRSTTNLNVYNGPSRFAENVESEKENLRQQLHAKEGEMERVKEQHDRLKSKYNQLIRDKDRIIARQRTASQDITRFKSRIQRIQQSVEEQDVTNVPLYEGMLNDVRDEISTLQSQMPDLIQKARDDRAKFEENKKEYEDLKKELAKEKVSVENIQKEMKDFSRTTAQLESAINHYRKKYFQHEKEFRDAKKIFEKSNEVYRSMEEQGEIRKLEALVKQAEEEFGSRDQFMKRLRVKHDTLQQVEEEVHTFTMLIDTLKSAFVKRSSRAALFKKYVTNRCKQLFGSFVHKRGYRGQLDINHDSGHLMLRVDVEGEHQEDDDHGQDEVDDRDPKSLSGGEKSYAQICLLLSLWSSMHTPFRCLDEFDVFMDAVNRRLAVKLLIDYARTDGNASQFLLISPQNTAHLKELSGPDINVLKMNPPERGQRQLNFATVAAAATAQ